MQITYTLNPNSIQSSSFINDLNTAIGIIDLTFTANVTVNLEIGYGVDAQQGTTLTNQNVSYAGPAELYGLSYTSLRSDLLSANRGIFTSTNLPNVASVNGVSEFSISAVQARLFGMLPANGGSTIDGYVSIGTGFSAGTERVDTFLHEITHALGRDPDNFTSGGTTYYSSFDLFRFLSGGGGRDFNGTTNPSVSNPVPQAYFSLNGGAMDLADFGVYSDPSDFLNSQGETPLPAPYSNLTPNDPFDEYIEGNRQFTAQDLQIMEALGFKTAPPPNPPPPAGTTADMILRDGSGNYEIYNIGNNSILFGGPLGQVGTDYQFGGLGTFNGTDTADMMLRSSSTGAFEVYDISNNNITGAANLGAVGLNYQLAGFGNFNGPGATDMMLRNVSNGAFESYDINNNAITGAFAIGAVGLDYQVAGFGDFNGDGTTDMMLRSSTTGVFEDYDIQNGQLVSAYNMGAVGLDWQVAGFGDFDGDGTTNMMLRNVNSGVFELYDIANNTIVGANTIGAVGLDWQVAGFGPCNGAGTFDMVLRNVNSGAFEVYDIANNQLTGAAPLGAVGTNFVFGGIAADPPGMPLTGAATSASSLGGATAHSNVQAQNDGSSAGLTLGYGSGNTQAMNSMTPAQTLNLVQAMSSFTSDGGTPAPPVPPPSESISGALTLAPNMLPHSA